MVVSLGPDWDAKLAAFSSATLFHTSAWARVLTETYGYRPLYLTAGDTDEPTGILPLMEVDSWLTGRRGLALPFTDDCQILAHDPATARTLWERALQLGRERNWRWLELRDNPEWLNDAPASTTFYHHVLALRPDGDGVAEPLPAPGLERVAEPLPAPKLSEREAVPPLSDPTSEREAVPPPHAWPSKPSEREAVSPPQVRASGAQLFSRCDSANRRAIRKAQQANLTIEITQTAEAMRAFFGLMQRTRQRHGLPPQPYRFFQSIHRHLIATGNGCIVLAKHGGEAVAGAVYLHHGTKALYKFGASDERHQQLRGNNLVMWEAIRWHQERGFTSLDFGRTSLHNDGLRRFKLGWGTTESQVKYHRFSYQTGDYTTSADRSSGWHSAIFRHLPRPLSRLAGEVLYRHIA